ncbi:conjugal transfer protein TraD [Dongshaea marina]|uniref:conjugal transfer protein TraD n=1 Tax=Dongshaea marina TaxID=2047966 RepID=UPI000D3E5858|nr:conjugal transfer protein TraD [Dongshaea marina]
MVDSILDLNEPGRVIEVTECEALELGAFEETALSEVEALDASEGWEDADGCEQ